MLDKEMDKISRSQCKNLFSITMKRKIPGCSFKSYKNTKVPD